MILRYLAYSLGMLIFVTASDPHFGSDLTWQKLPKENIDNVRELPWMDQDNFRKYLMDHDDLVSDTFRVKPYFYPSVNFWFLIYTQFESSFVVIHDKQNLKLIYKVLDFSSLHAKGLTKNVLYVLKRKMSEEKLDEFKADLNVLLNNPFSLSLKSKNIFRILKAAGINPPIKKMARAAFFRRLRDNIRTQTGQKDFIRKGIVSSLPYKKFLEEFFEQQKLPRELLAVPFLESSFNPKAESKVGAMGVWQFMPLISSYYLPKRTRTLDYRSNVGIVSLAAAFLMQDNFKVMRSWDLAVTAYNSGTKHLLKTKRELAGKHTKIDLEDIIKHSDSQHFGFASKNFYSEFLALVHALAYEEELFTGLHRQDRPDVNDPLRYFITKCSLRLEKVLNDDQKSDVAFHNHHMKELSHTVSRGFMQTAKSKLPEAEFLEIKNSQLFVIKPKDWGNLLRNQSCSTR